MNPEGVKQTEEMLCPVGSHAQLGPCGKETTYHRGRLQRIDRLRCDRNCFSSKK